ncbi:PorP/SprF family type IX secretion system membrane protein [Marivirga arenosa]|uniref:Type IX secretion system membrane protein PorP/SprF n=1 Tax=Marivirga arenosa TaxID=3059076 RepID=A0AA49GDK9_9BACT|nr:type IX secretion system membrane protein PorP/SprF [Marivirga sp. BKB1-2]WKK78925.2 type IX secretion system membrane protein PorP/SprF [Marivirga sp. BKB1-2]
MRKILITIILFTIASTAFSQQKSVLSQYRFNQLIINPAYAGHKNDLTVNLLHRNQWVNLEGAPVSNIASVHTGIKDKHSGFGLTFVDESIGVHKSMALFGVYSFSIEFQTGTLAAGIQGGFNQLNSNFQELNLQSQNDVVFSTFQNSFNPNFGVGLFYSNKNGFIGLSSPYIVENRVLRTGSGLTNAQEARYYFLTGGYLFPINKDVIFYPSAMVRVQENAPIGFDINANAILQDILNVGLSYRSGDALSMMCSITVNENFTFGYAYDNTLSNIRNYTNDTHELMLIYRINLYKEKCFTYF